MADRTPLKIADRNAISPNAISDDDPFAELTRIMGFDPRQPVQPQPAADPVMGDDFDIDLEKELMGEFGLDADDSDDEVAAVQNVPSVSAEASGQGAHGHDPHDLPDMPDLDEAVAASMQDFDLETGGEPEQSAVPEVEFESDFDDALTQSFELDSQPVARWPAANESHAPAVEEPAIEEDAGYASEAFAEPDFAESDFEGHFDDAMADLDMDFDAHLEPAYEAPQAPEIFAHDTAAYDEPVAYEAAQDVEPQPVAAAANPFDDAFSFDLDDVSAEAPAPVVVEPVPVAEERSLEDELNALLGNMGARVAAPALERAQASSAWPDAPATAKAVDPYLVAGMGYGAQPPLQSTAPQASAVEASDPAADLEALLMNELATPEIANEDHLEPAAEAEAEDVSFDFDAADLESLAVEVEPEQVEAAAPAQPILSRFWNRVTPVAAAVRPETQAQPAPVYQQEAAPESAPVYQPEEPVYQPEEAVQSIDTQSAVPAYQPAAPAYEEAPDIETVDVPERVVALADDLDIPELAFEEDRPASPSFDDLDAEFAGLLNEMNGADAASAPSQAVGYDDAPYDSGFAQGAAAPYGSAQAYAAQPLAQAPAMTAAAYDEDGFDAPSRDDRPFAPVDSFDQDQLDYDPELDEAMAVPGLAMAESASQPRRRGLFIAAMVGAVAVIGGIGAFALSPGGSGSSDAPVIVKADDSPIKVKPENPGGTVVPNQDNKVYEAVAKGIQPAAPTQEKLVANTAEPVNVNAAEPQKRVIDLLPDDGADIAADDTAAPIAKSEDRIQQSAEDADAGDTNRDVALVTPRKVRTMVVKPDGTLAPREDVTPATPQVAAAEPADPAPQRVVTPAASQDLTGAVPAAADTAVDEPAVKPAAKAQSATTPATVAAAPQRPSDQPVDIVGEVKPDEVASISPTAAAAGSWSMQIASQPSAESAQATYKDLARRYGSVLEGHSVNIVKAEIAGKGTFYRVRVPANSRNDAITLCESYKAAGGNCFVSK